MFRLVRGLLPVQVAAVSALLSAICFATASDTGALMGLTLLMMIPAVTAQRATLFEAALPIATRSVMLSRNITALVLAWVPLSIWVLISLLHPTTDSPQIFFHFTLSHKIEAMSVVALAIAATNLVEPGVLSLPPSRSLAVAPLVFIASLALTLLLPATIFLPITITATVAAAWRSWFTLPASFQLAPVALGDGKRPLAVPGVGGTHRAHWWHPILRSCTSIQSMLGAIVMVTSLFDGPLAIYMALYVPTFLIQTRQQTSWMRSLPFSQRRMLWTTVGSVVVPFLAPALIVGIVLASMGAREYPNSNAPRTRTGAHHFYYFTGVSLPFWKRAPDGIQPVIQAPWGETSAAQLVHIAGLTLYNPYSADQSSTKEFHSWQFGRMTEALYGRSISVAQWDSGQVKFPSRVTRTKQTFVLGAALVLTLALMFALLCELPRWHRLGGSKFLRAAAIAVATAPAVVVFCAEMYFMGTIGGSITSAIAEAGLFRASQMLPSHMGPLLIAAALPPVTMYCLLEMLYRNSEITGTTAQVRLRQ